jgi:hypothetical protein
MSKQLFWIKKKIDIGYCICFEGEVRVHQENHGEVGLGVLSPWRYSAATANRMPPFPCPPRGCFVAVGQISSLAPSSRPP